MDTSSRKRVIALPFPMQGHINPMLQLCYQLLECKSFDIVFVNTVENHRRLRGTEAPDTMVCPLGTITFVAISAPDSFNGGPNESLNACLVAADQLQVPFEQLLVKLGRVSCLISDGYLGWSQAAAEKFKLARVALWTSNVAYSLVNYNIPLLMQNGYVSRPVDSPGCFEEDHLVKCVPGLDPLHPRDLPSVLHFESKEDPGFVNRIAKVRTLKRAAWVLVNSFEEIEGPGVEAMRVQLASPNYVTVGPLLLEQRMSLWKEDETCFCWLDVQKPGSVLYISFGSIASIPGAQLVNIAKGLEMIRQPFLWAMRPNLLAEGSGSCREFFQQFEERTRKQGQGLVVEWLPQVEVLKHGAIGGHLSHCGWNSVMESMWMGVPILGWPCIAEQTMNCKRIVNDWKIGLRFTRDSGEFVSDSEVGRVVKKLFSQDGLGMRERAKELSGVIRDAIKPGGSSHRNLERFVQSLQELATLTES